MARPREFDREAALASAIEVFWSKGFAATSTEDLLQAMKIGRQSLYNAFGGKRQLYLEALRTYQRSVTSEHVRRLLAPASPAQGLVDLLVGLVPEDDARRGLGCMGVSSVIEFGASDTGLVEMRDSVGPLLQSHLVERIREGQKLGQFNASLDAEQAAGFIQMTMTGLQTGARGGAGAPELHRMAQFAVDRLRPV